MHKTLPVCAVLLFLTISAAAFAEEKQAQPAAPQTSHTAKVPHMSEIPVMQEQGKRMSALMEKIQFVTDPAERKRMLAEATCPQ